MDTVCFCVAEIPYTNIQWSALFIATTDYKVKTNSMLQIETSDGKNYRLAIIVNKNVRYGTLERRDD